VRDIFLRCNTTISRLEVRLTRIVSFYLVGLVVRVESGVRNIIALSTSLEKDIIR
jgi:hypothetical protein